jgi:cell division FtsZ-interacting protein ZapD
MARTKKITTNSSTEDIITEICKVEEEITVKTTELKELKAKKRNLNKWLSEAENRENEEKNKETLDRVVSLMKEKGISVNDIEDMLNK